MFGGWSWIIPAVIFFGGSSLLTAWSSTSRKVYAPADDSPRNTHQLLANGGVAWFFLMAHAFYPTIFFYAAFIGALSAATADTWATEIGRFSKSKPINITSGEKVRTGTSGGITLLGTAGSILGALVISGTALLFVDASALYVFAAGLIAGFLGAIVDSVVGALWQARYRAPSGKIVEDPPGKGVGYRLESGWPWMSNDTVNYICTGSGALIALILAIIIL